MRAPRSLHLDDVSTAEEQAARWAELVGVEAPAMRPLTAAA
jgi:hypothetical protein